MDLTLIFHSLIYFTENGKVMNALEGKVWWSCLGERQNLRVADSGGLADLEIKIAGTPVTLIGPLCHRWLASLRLRNAAYRCQRFLNFIALSA